MATAHYRVDYIKNNGLINKLVDGWVFIAYNYLFYFCGHTAIIAWLMTHGL